jgi:transglycosylase-like protein with SLT domain
MLRITFTAVFCLLTGVAHALPDARASPFLFRSVSLSPGEQCRSGIAAAERGHGIPPQLMAAIGRVESGRLDPGTGTWGAWPWTINAEGQGTYFETKAEAINAVLGLQAHGVRSIDVGCMQVNLMHHPQAFANLEQAFEPAINADYAARFLVDLHNQTGDWTRATANYHSANPWEGEPYAAKVASVWPEEQRKAGLNPPTPLQAIGTGRPFPGAMSGFPIRPPPRMFALAGGTPPATMQTGSAPLGLAPPTTSPGRIFPLGMTQAEATPPAALSARGMVGSGRGLAFYRAMPVRAVMPLRPMYGLPGVVTR